MKRKSSAILVLLLALLGLPVIASDAHAEWNCKVCKKLKNKTRIRAPSLNLVKGHSVLASIPDGVDEYRSVFGVAPTTRQQRSVDVARREMATIRLTHLVVDKEQLEGHIKSDPATVITIIGHNEGGVFRLRNGTHVALPGLHSFCQKHHKNCVFLSCHADKFLPDDVIAANADLTFGIAVEVAKEIDIFVVRRVGKPLSSISGLGNIVRKALRVHLQKAHGNISPKLIEVIVSGVIAKSGSKLLSLSDSEGNTETEPVIDDNSKSGVIADGNQKGQGPMSDEHAVPQNPDQVPPL